MKTIEPHPGLNDPLAMPRLRTSDALGQALAVTLVQLSTAQVALDDIGSVLTDAEVANDNGHDAQNAGGSR